MEIKLLKPGYKKNEEFYKDFLNGDILSKDYIDEGKVVNIDNEILNFPIYLANHREEDKKTAFIEMIRAVENICENLTNDEMFDATFWHSYICLYLRPYILEEYPQVKESKEEFNKIVIRNFDWGHYIYKAVIAYEFISSHTKDKEEQEKYYRRIVENSDLYNYIIKYEIFRNSNFLVNILDIIEETNTSKLLKSQIKGRGKDARYGRIIVYEFNKSYPIILSPMLEKEDLKKIFLEYLEKKLVVKSELEEVEDFL